jgi:hypothetical protein
MDGAHGRASVARRIIFASAARLPPIVAVPKPSASDSFPKKSLLPPGHLQTYAVRLYP